ncbi:ribonuclease P complex subunit Pop2 [Delphinella strobiligena]|nr:ribonuclease P complex subunit Pop2 [Delphinella strobiligena]
MFYDLNVEYNASRTPSKDSEITRALSFLSELGYNAVALNHTIAGKLPSDLSCAIPDPLPFPVPSSLNVLRRCTLILSESATNNRIAALSANYDILALRPVDEKTFQHACSTAECDLISLDLTQRLGYHFKFKTVSEAVKRGVRFEVCYSQGLLGESLARRNLISNVVQLIRATRGGRGIIVSSEAKKAVACRAPWDVVNLAAIWGLSQERAHEAVSKEVRSVVASARLKRTSFKGVVDVVYGGEKPQPKAAQQVKEVVGQNGASKKRKADSQAENSSDAGGKSISKREQKRRAKAKAEANKPINVTPT